MLFILGILHKAFSKYKQQGSYTYKCHDKRDYRKQFTLNTLAKCSSAS